MASFNKVIMAGNLTRDPELSYLPSQTPVAEFGLAVSRRWRDKQSGQQREAVCFIDCRCYGRQAETIKKYMAKGRPILIEGRLDFDQWEGQDGQRRSKHRIFVENFTFLGGGGGGGGGGQGPGQSQGGYNRGQDQGGYNTPPPPRQQPAAPAAPTAPPGPDAAPAPQHDDEPPPSDYDGGGDDIPF